MAMKPQQLQEFEKMVHDKMRQVYNDGMTVGAKAIMSAINDMIERGKGQPCKMVLSEIKNFVGTVAKEENDENTSAS